MTGRFIQSGPSVSLSSAFNSTPESVPESRSRHSAWSVLVKWSILLTGLGLSCVAPAPEAVPSPSPSPGQEPPGDSALPTPPISDTDSVQRISSPSPIGPFDVVELTARQIQADYAAGQYTAEELTRAFLDRIAGYEGHYNAFISMNPSALDCFARLVSISRVSGTDAPVVCPG